MKRLVLVLSMAAALGCGSVDEKQACGASTDCPSGQWCARGGGESRCWPDAVPPTAAVTTASCTPSPCVRDGVLHVVAAVTDDNEVLDASVSLDLDASQSFPMARSGGSWVADVPLRMLPFDAFLRDVVPTVVARDGARNASTPASGAGVAVTRLRWERAVDSGATGLTVGVPAVMPDGSVVLGGSNAKVYFVAADGTNAHSPLTVGAGQITAAPAVGQHAIWVGSEDGKLYAVQLDGTAVIANVGVNIGGPVKGSIAITTSATKDTAFATCKLGDNTGNVGAATTSANEYSIAATGDGFSAGPLVDINDRVHSPTANGTNDATLRTFTLSAPFVLSASWTASIGKGSPAPLALDATGAVVAPSDETTPKLKRTVPGTSPTVSSLGDLLAFARDSAVILASGDAVVGDENGNLYRFSASGAVWSTPPNLGSAVRAPMVLTGTTAPFIVPTNAGKVYALADDGTTRWQATLPSATQLRAGNIHTPPSQPAGPTMSTAYFSSGNGRLYAVVVDGQLDGAAPWPKAFHDPRNTSHAGPQP